MKTGMATKFARVVVALMANDELGLIGSLHAAIVFYRAIRLRRRYFPCKPPVA